MNPTRQGPPDHAPARGYRRKEGEDGEKGRPERVSRWVDRAKAEGRGKSGDPEERAGAKAVVRGKIDQIKERRRARKDERRGERQERGDERREGRGRPEGPSSGGRDRAREAGGNAYGRGGRPEGQRGESERRPASASTGSASQSSPAQKDAERRMGPPDQAKAYGHRGTSPDRGNSGERPAPGGPSSGPMADQAAKREEFKSRMMERRASRGRDKGEPPEDRGNG